MTQFLSIFILFVSFVDRINWIIESLGIQARPYVSSIFLSGVNYPVLFGGNHPGVFGGGWELSDGFWVLIIQEFLLELSGGFRCTDIAKLFDTGMI